MIPGFLLSLFVLAPNLLMVIYPPQNVPPARPLPKSIARMELVERVGQAACFLIPFFYALDLQTIDLLDGLALGLMAVCLLVYSWGWARYLREGRAFALLFRGYWGLWLPMAVAPVLYFGGAAVLFRSAYLGLAVALLAWGHLAVSQHELQRVEWAAGAGQDAMDNRG